MIWRTQIGNQGQQTVLSKFGGAPAAPAGRPRRAAMRRRRTAPLTCSPESWSSRPRLSPGSAPLQVCSLAGWAVLCCAVLCYAVLCCELGGSRFGPVIRQRRPRPRAVHVLQPTDVFAVSQPRSWQSWSGIGWRCWRGSGGGAWQQGRRTKARTRALRAAARGCFQRGAAVAAMAGWRPLAATRHGGPSGRGLRWRALSASAAEAVEPLATRWMTTGPRAATAAVRIPVYGCREDVLV